MDIHLFPMGDGEKPQQRHGILAEKILGFGPDAAFLDDESVDHPAPPAEGGEPQARAALVLIFQRGAEDAGKVAHFLGIEEVVLHEPFDRAGAGMVGIAHQSRHPFLHVEGQAVFFPVGQVMKIGAHRGQVILGLGEAPGLALGNHAERHHGGDLFHPVNVFGDPEQRMKVAKAALAFLDVGLQNVTRIAGPLMPLVALGKLGFDERRPGTPGDFRPEAGAQGLEQLRLAGHQPGLQHGGADGDVALAAPHAFVHRPDRLAHLEAEIPQQIEDVFDDLFGITVLLVGQQEQEVDVGMGRQFGPAITAHGHQRHALSGGGIGAGIDGAGGELEQRRDQPIGHRGVGGDQLGAVERAREKPRAGFRAGQGKRFGRGIKHRRAQLGDRLLACRQGLQPHREYRHHRRGGAGIGVGMVG